MKKILFSAVSALALVGVAVAANSTEFAVFYVPSSAKETIVAVPWLASGTGTDVTNDAVKVCDLVLTAGLDAGDELKYYTGSGYQVWTLVEDAKGVKSWQSGTMVTANAVQDTQNAQDQKIMRGQAIILKRANPGAGFHIMGKPSDASGEVTLATASSGKCYTLVAPPSVAATNPNSLTWTGINGKTDSIIVPQDDGSLLSLGYMTSGGWVKWNGTAWVDAGACIPAGKGVWFTTTGTGSKSVKW